MTGHAALLIGERRIDRAQDLAVVDGDERRARAAVGGLREGFDGLGHLGVDRRRGDVPARASDPTQHKRGVRAELLVEGLDRMGTECRRHRRVLAELRAQARIIGHERVDKLKRGRLFIDLLGDERHQARPIEMTRHRGADGTGEDQIDNENPPGLRANKSNERAHRCLRDREGGIISL
jgi:hypothetical protein